MSAWTVTIGKSDTLKTHETIRLPYSKLSRDFKETLGERKKALQQVLGNALMLEYLRLVPHKYLVRYRESEEWNHSAREVTITVYLDIDIVEDKDDHPRI